MIEPYVFVARDLPELLIRRFYPERTGRESVVIRAYLRRHGAEFDRLSFSVRVGEGQAVHPDIPEGIARSINFSSRKRIDILGWQGNTPTIVEAKERLAPQVLGQLQGYRHLLLEEMPHADEPRLVAIGRYSDPDTLRVLAANAVDVFLYPDGDGG